jgi:ATP-dependent DNA ligase
MGVRSWPLHGKDIRKWSQGTRQGRLQALVSRFDCPVLLHSEAFGDGETLVRVAEKHELEGAVSKRRDALYSFHKRQGLLAPNSRRKDCLPLAWVGPAQLLSEAAA